MIEAGQRRPTILYGVPSCVPALLGFETAARALPRRHLGDAGPLRHRPGEVMDYRAVVRGDERMRAIVVAAREKLIDGHCTNLSGAEPSAYLAEGIDSDHTKNPAEIHVEKARMGMLVMIQEKSVRLELFEAISALPIRLRSAGDGRRRAGRHRRARPPRPRRALRRPGPAAAGGAPGDDLTPAQRLRLYDRGIVSPGKRADLVLLPGACQLRAERRHCRAEGRRPGWRGRPPRAANANLPFRDTVKIDTLSADDAGGWTPACPIPPQPVQFTPTQEGQEGSGRGYGGGEAPSPPSAPTRSTPLPVPIA